MSKITSELQDELLVHYGEVLKGLLDGDIVPLLGAGANLCGRPVGRKWLAPQQVASNAEQAVANLLPSGAELSTYLAQEFNYPTDEDPNDLIRVSQYVAVGSGDGPLYAELRRIFDAAYEPTPLHMLLASLPGILRAKRRRHPYQLIVTTNYDDTLEAAFDRVREPYDLVSYIAVGAGRGKFYHTPPDGKGRLIEKANKYTKLSLDDRTVILKLHGAVNRSDSSRDSYVITEDHYIDYLTRTDISNLIPVTLAAKLRRSHFLFLGYSLRDWNLRVILHRIWGEQSLSWKSWAVQLNPHPLDERFWEKRGVDILDASLEGYIEELKARLGARGGV